MVDDGHSHVEPHIHDGNTGSHCHLSVKYTEYIKIHLDDLKFKCHSLMACINKLLAQQSPISVLKGENLSLDKVCSLINIKGNSTHTMLDGKCTIRERLDIRDDVETHLKDKVEKRDSWDDVAVCLENNYGDEERSSYVHDICGLAEKNKEICSNYQTHKQVEKFVNEQIEHLQCTCKSLHRDHDHSHGPSALMIGLGVGGGVLLCIILGLLFFCYRRKKNKKKTKRAPNVIYLPSPNSDNCPVYQEIFDMRAPPQSPPSLPSRYGSRPLPGMPEEAEYLEPVKANNSYRSKAPPPLISNPGYHGDAPPEYSETAQTYHDATLMEEGDRTTYFEPIATPKGEKPAGYDSLQQNDAANGSPPQQYAPLIEDTDNVDVNKPLGPIPAKRTKKEDRETESEYFELEKVDVHTQV